MSDQTTNQGPTNQGPEKDSSDLVGELREMGQQLEAAFRAAIESDRAKQLQRDLSNGVRELTSQLQTALKNVQEHPRVQQAEERGREVFSQAQQSKVVQDVQETVVTGISQLNLQLRKLVERIEADRAAGGATGNWAGPTSSQHVPVEHETTTPPTTPASGATGETTRLDDNDQTVL